jgi:hypothetical protein
MNRFKKAGKNSSAEGYLYFVANSGACSTRYSLGSFFHPLPGLHKQSATKHVLRQSNQFSSDAALIFISFKMQIAALPGFANKNSLDLRKFAQ